MDPSCRAEPAIKYLSAERTQNQYELRGKRWVSPGSTQPMALGNLYQDILICRCIGRVCYAILYFIGDFMPASIPLIESDFYKSFPDPDHLPGDIWNGLPTFGIFSERFLRGIVITPACDLANEKCESITYLPIVSIDSYLGSMAFRYDCWLEIKPLLSRLAGYKDIPEPGRFELWPVEFLDFTQGISRDMKGKSLSVEEIEKIDGYREYVLSAHAGTAKAHHLSKFFKADKFKIILSRLVGNSLKADVHFLPSDGLDRDYSAIEKHSLVLFRYPMSLPIECMNRAKNMLDEREWAGYVEKNRKCLPVLSHMPIRPIKLSSLKGEFFSDLISRYLNMYIRLGSPDFEDGRICKIVDEIMEGV
ncbi:hypothetical protein [Chromobacterium vaccinii]|uniref:hypothetical protein n=1 Tax=Chromobacterium vaccinii TaxID=1108595 RepID=UPI001319C2D4|nr:hypothetical protein [Chromobacterium vaccinii]